MKSLKPRFFKTPADLRRWYERHHAEAPELLVGFYKKASGRASVTYQEALDEALCFGWIDGVRKSIDDVCYTIRFTRRRPRGNWSRVNIKRVDELTRLGRMHPAGLKTFRERNPANPIAYSYEESLRTLDAACQRTFRRNRSAWEFFESQPPSYRRVASWFVMSAKREETRMRRLAMLIEDSAKGRRLAQATPPSRRAK